MTMSFFPIRDMVLSRLPNVTKNFAADASLDRLAAGHDPARRRQDAGAEPREHIRHVVAAEVDAAAWTAHPLDPGDHALAARTVLQEHLELRLDALAGLRFGHLEALDVAFALEDARDFHLEAR